MSNMHYCRYQNTLQDMEEIQEEINDVNELKKLSKEERRAALKLLEVCIQISETAKAYDDAEEAE